MTLEEMIEKKEAVADHYKHLIDSDNYGYGFIGGKDLCIECYEEHRQLAEWLKDYKRMLDSRNADDPDIYVGRWIPCDECLPDDDEVYLVAWTYEDRSYCPYEHFYGLLSYNALKEEWNDIDRFPCSGISNPVVLAWMPLPKQYKCSEKDIK